MAEYGRTIRSPVTIVAADIVCNQKYKHFRIGVLVVVLRLGVVRVLIRRTSTVRRYYTRSADVLLSSLLGSRYLYDNRLKIRVNT